MEDWVSNVRQSRRQRTNTGVLHADVGVETAEWLRNQKKNEGVSWRTYFKNLKNNLITLYTDRQELRNQVEDMNKDTERLSRENESLRQEIWDLKKKLS